MRKDYRHFGARSTVKIGPAKRHHTAGHHVMAKTRSARRHRQGPKAARTRGRSEATSLARCRAQIEHRWRDGRRIRRGPARCHHARPKRATIVIRATPDQSRHRARNECDFGTRISRTNGTRLSGRIWFRFARAHLRPNSRRFRGPTTDAQTTDTDTDSHGVSDPSGHARGHFQRAHRGRSRHGFLL